MRKIFSLLFVFIIVITMCAVVRVDAESPINPHIKAVYEYNENGEGTGADFTGCLGGSEAGCTDILSTKTASSTYAVGTIIKYEVKDGEERYFNVIHDDGTTLTLQERQNTVSNVAWGGAETTSGKALYELEQATNDWNYVNTQNYSIGDNTTTLGYSGCSSSSDCSTATYTLTRSAKARMITVQELASLNCISGTDTTAIGSCSSFVYNYLNGTIASSAYFQTSRPVSFDTDENGSYRSISSYSDDSIGNWYVGTVGFISYSTQNSSGARAVVVIDKAGAEVTPPTPSESDATPEQGETINTEDTLKMSYLGYILGVFVIFAGAYVIYLGIEKKYDNEEE